MVYLVVEIIISLVASYIIAIKTMHIFQLNSYKIKVQIKWMIKHTQKYIPNLCFILFALAGGIYYKIFVCLYIVLNILMMKKNKAKKPLVYTARVVRLLITFSIIITLSVILSFLSSYIASETFLLSITLALTPIFVILADILNMPIEKSLKLGYIRSAKKMLGSMPNLIKIGITGSFGKTSTKFYLHTLLKAKYNTLMTPESFNTPMGVVKTIRENLKATDEIFISEMGARNVGDIKELCEIVHPKYGIITSIGHQHLESFNTIENIIKTKLELANEVDTNGMIFVNGDDDLILANIKNKKYISYGFSEHNDYIAYDISIDKSGTHFKIKTKNKNEDDNISFSTSLIGRHNVLNIMGAIALANYMGISLKELKAQVKKIPQVPHRMQIIKSGTLTIIDDSYNSNPSGAKEALNTLSLFDSYKVLITPGMVELGSKEDECNYEFGVDASKVCDYIVLVGDKQTKVIYNGVISTGYSKEKIFVAASFNDALSHVINIKSEKEKIVLFENDLPDNY